jgi:PAS domain S-box-containing protein
MAGHIGTRVQSIHLDGVGPAVAEVALAAGLVLDSEIADAIVLALPEREEEREAKLATVLATGPVLVVGDDAEVAFALAHDVEAVRWPCSPQVLRLRLDSAVQRRQMAFHRRVFELMPDSVECTDLNLRLEEVNASFEEMTGFRLEKVRGFSPGEMYRTGRKDADVYKDIGAAFERNEVWQGPLVQRKQDGSVFFPHSILAPVEQGPVRIGYLGIKRDSTRDEFSRGAEAATERRMQEIVEKAGDALFVVTLTGGLADVNHVACDIVGLTRTELLMRRFAHLLVSMPKPLLDQMVAVNPGPPVNIEVDIRRDDGTTVPVELRSGRITLGGEDFLLILARDITERRRAKEALKSLNADLAAASRAKDEFLASMSHELRTPLNAILNMSESLQEGIYGPITEKQKRPVRMVEESGRHLLSLINDILDLAQVGAGTIKLSMQTVIVKDVCHASVQFIKEQAHKKRVKVTTSFDHQVTFIQADERRLKQILVNLLNNAVKFTPEGGAVGLEVTGSSETNTVHFSVWDTGVGIPTEEQSRLFKPFVQLDAGLNRRYEGTGLGLSLVAQMTKLHGGDVHLESAGPGQGARFTVSLPWSDTRIKGPPKAPDILDVICSAARS